MSESTAAENSNEAEANESLDKPRKIIINSDLSDKELMRIIEAALFSAGQTLKIDRLMDLFPDDKHPGKEAISDALETLQEQYLEHSSLELKEVSSGFRFQVRDDYSSWVAKLFEERPARYSRATLETLALIAYRQPITRAEIEEVRGVGVSSQIIKTMIERDWIRVIGHRDVPGKPALYSTTKGFLDYFNLKSLTELPALADLRDIDAINAELDLHVPIIPSVPTATKDEEADVNIDSDEIAATIDDIKSDSESDSTAEVIH
ncbi:MAG: SMC-Scp complex subunit ScpB [Gammaproteobacteria bacterium]|nr:SMC-Scp complex subunit ScpB [Gammaproteobacteria bacterium]MCW8987166.1 SMC-Scp complex subunit ScpB [Gammaproteobacteria bacterium]MCW9031229.1 SMC-Scp complex subunit ScpB [Gammaproteobacteria bacterium]